MGSSKRSNNKRGRSFARLLNWVGARSFATAFVAVVIVCGCSTRHYEWTEDVDLGDGRTIEIEREVKFKFSLPGGGGTATQEETYAAIRFKGSLSQLPPWREALVALELYQDTKNREWTVVAATASCEAWERGGKPKPPYWEFRLRDGAWRRVALSTTSIGRKTNLFFEYFDMTLDHVTIAEKDRIQSDPRIARGYREIWGDPEMRVCGEGNPNKV